MRLAPLAVAAACVLVVAGCAPESMATHAVPAQHSAPSIITPMLDAAPAEEQAAEAAGGAAQAKVAEDSQQGQVELAPPTDLEESDAADAMTQETPASEEAAAPSPADPVAPVSSMQPEAPSSPAASPAPAAPSSTPSESATVAPPAPPGSQWRDVHLDDLAFSEASRLEAVSPSFRDYAEQAMSAADTDGCTVLGLGVMSVHPAGYVVGSVSTDCGGGQAIWVENGDRTSWRIAMVLQAPPQCTELMKIGLPAGVGLLCDGGAGKLREY